MGLLLLAAAAAAAAATAAAAAAAAAGATQKVGSLGAGRHLTTANYVMIKLGVPVYTHPYLTQPDGLSYHLDSREMAYVSAPRRPHSFQMGPTKYIHTSIHPSIHLYIHQYIHTSTYTVHNTYTHTHTRITHTHIHTHIHTYIYIHRGPGD